MHLRLICNDPSQLLMHQIALYYDRCYTLSNGCGNWKPRSLFWSCRSPLPATMLKYINWTEISTHARTSRSPPSLNRNIVKRIHAILIQEIGNQTMQISRSSAAMGFVDFLCKFKLMSSNICEAIHIYFPNLSRCSWQVYSCFIFGRDINLGALRNALPDDTWCFIQLKY